MQYHEEKRKLYAVTDLYSRRILILLSMRGNNPFFDNNYSSGYLRQVGFNNNCRNFFGETC